MKKIILLSVMVLGSFLIETIDAQIRVNVNIGLQPIWGPVGYDYAEYYYLPDLDIYYYIPGRQYVIFEDGQWMYMNTLPWRFRNVDLFHMYKVVINDPRPFMNHNYYRSRYASYRNRYDQDFIRDSRDSRYYAIYDHPMHNQWERERGRSNDRDGYNSYYNEHRNDNSYNNDNRNSNRENSRYQNHGRNSDQRDYNKQERKNSDKGNRNANRGRGNKDMRWNRG
jgi:hypothetical protein